MTRAWVVSAVTEVEGEPLSEDVYVDAMCIGVSLDDGYVTLTMVPRLVAEMAAP